LVEKDPRWKVRYEELNQACGFVRKFGPLVDALHAAPEPVPERRLSELRRALRQQSFAQAQPPLKRREEARPWFAPILAWMQQYVVAAGAVAVLLSLLGFYLIRQATRRDMVDMHSPDTVAYFLSGDGRVEVGQRARAKVTQPFMPLRKGEQVVLAGGTAVFLTPAGVAQLQGPAKTAAETLASFVAKAVGTRSASTVRTALFQPIRQVPLPRWRTTAPTGQDIVIYSPRDATRSLTPLILWKGEPGKTYEVSIQDEANRNAKPLRAAQVTSPVEFERVPQWAGLKLVPDRRYRLVLRETGSERSTTAHTFYTLDDATADALSQRTPAPSLERAYLSLSVEPRAVGDALAALLSLPTELADTELVLRLKLVAFQMAELSEEYKAVLEKLTQLAGRPDR
jgi:hypothetical protein